MTVMCNIYVNIDITQILIGYNKHTVLILQYSMFYYSKRQNTKINYILLKH